jgi:dTDP-4-dehydrorhamnose reductase
MTYVGILGSSGMLGSHLERVFENSKFEVIAFSRSHGSSSNDKTKCYLDATKEGWQSNLEKPGVVFTYLINCIGIIRHKIDPKDSKSITNAVLVNSLFSIALTDYCVKRKIRLIQIFTDCVYSGESGFYSESSPKSPIDLYGFTKSIGEASASLSMNIRCSFIGLETSTDVELMSWALSEGKKNKISGYIDHKWNGVTAFQLGKLIKSILEEDKYEAGTQHFVPANSVSKFELIQLISTYGAMGQIDLVGQDSGVMTDRTLTTDHIQKNRDYWTLAGYSEPPTIAYMIEEYFAHFKGTL